MSAPRSSGVWRYGVANVLSTTSRAPARLRRGGDRGDVDDVEQRVRRRLDPDEPCVGDVRVGVGRELVGRRVREPVALRLVDLREHPVRAAVHVVDADDVVARVEQVHDRGRRPDPGRERVAVRGVLERCEALLERRSRRVRAARVVVALVDADGLLRERRRLVDRRRDRARRRVRLLAGVDRAGVEVHGHGSARRAAGSRPILTPRTAWPAWPLLSRRTRQPPSARGTFRPITTDSAPSHAASSRAPRGFRARVGWRAPLCPDAVHLEHPALPVEDRLDPADQLRSPTEDRAGRSTRTRASPSARTSRACSGSRTAPRRGRGRGSAGRRGRGASRGRARRRRVASGCASHPARVSRTPSARKRRSSSARSASRSESASVSGRTRSARSQRRCPPRRPATATSPRRWSDVSISPTLRRAVPAVRLLARRRERSSSSRDEQRAAALELAQHIAAERPVLGEEVADPALGLVVRRVPPAPHEPAHEGELLDRPQERVPLEERALVPEQPVELSRRRTRRACSRGRGAVPARRSRSGRAGGSRGGGPSRGRSLPTRRAAATGRRSAGPPLRRPASPGVVGRSEPAPDGLRHGAPSPTRAGCACRRGRLGAEPGRELAQRVRNVRAGVGRRAALRPDGIDAEDASRRSNVASTRPISDGAAEDREDVVAVLALGCGTYISSR